MASTKETILHLNAHSASHHSASGHAIGDHRSDRSENLGFESVDDHEFEMVEPDAYSPQSAQASTLVQSPKSVASSVNHNVLSPSAPGNLSSKADKKSDAEIEIMSVQEVVELKDAIHRRSTIIATMLLERNKNFLKTPLGCASVLCNMVRETIVMENLELLKTIIGMFPVKEWEYPFSLVNQVLPLRFAAARESDATLIQFLLDQGASLKTNYSTEDATPAVQKILAKSKSASGMSSNDSSFSSYLDSQHEAQAHSASEHHSHEHGFQDIDPHHHVPATFVPHYNARTNDLASLSPYHNHSSGLGFGFDFS